MHKALGVDYMEIGAVGAQSLASTECKAPEPSSQVDGLLLPFLRANNTAASDDALACLINQAQPVIRSIIKSKLHVSFKSADGSRENQDALEIICEVQINLIAALRRLREKRSHLINSFQSYVAVITFNACSEYLRRKYPRRHGLKNRVRYLLTHRVDFSAWEIDGVMFCGLTAWRFQKRAPECLGNLRRAACGPDVLPPFNSAPASACSLPLAELVNELFHQANGPVELDELVALIANLQALKEEQPVTDVDLEELIQSSVRESLPGRSRNPALDVERRLRLERLWSEIRALPPKQRAALLLNLRDSQGGACISLFPITGVASVRELARALEMQAEELAALWNELPLDDAAIAGRLRLTRQQVINLRKSARERLARRMKDQW
jgi:RNA polymerase sigma factor (sigma-70 family)